MLQLSPLVPDLSLFSLFPEDTPEARFTSPGPVSWCPSVTFLRAHMLQAQELKLLLLSLC